jgi:hypothetical protein
MPIVAIPQLFASHSQAPSNDKLDAAISSKYPDRYLSLFPGQWLLVTGGKTAQEISDDLGITTGESGSAVVIVGTGSYFGRSNPQIWDWLRSRLGAPVA